MKLKKNMDSPPQTITVRGGDFCVRKKGRNLCRAWSCEEKAIGFGRERLVLENGVQMMWIVSMCVVCYNKEADKLNFTLLLPVN